MTEPKSTGLDAEDNKLLVLARGAMARAGHGSGAAVRDSDGRTYAAGPVRLQALSLTALQAAVAAALSSGAEGFEAALVVGGQLRDEGVAAVREVTPAARIILADRSGAVYDIVEAVASDLTGARVPEGFDLDTESEVFE
ncbi:cytidine deaminase [Nocardia sp. alder85J]|uniref:cytidine deaminase n=1 Tax=Nocardia sp. alder85J TaxID=2862949 RepID=UPI001CD2473C|nr:cytidine deaminase [Nocardia sp. alder85J]MCX4097549.1 cytidine deaminase [Nocardia sp. alder85J]